MTSLAIFAMHAQTSQFFMFISSSAVQLDMRASDGLICLNYALSHNKKTLKKKLLKGKQIFKKGQNRKIWLEKANVATLSEANEITEN